MTYVVFHISDIRKMKAVSIVERVVQAVDPPLPIQFQGNEVFKSCFD